MSLLNVYAVLFVNSVRVLHEGPGPASRFANQEPDAREASDLELP